MVRIVDFSPSSQAANLAALKERRASLDQAMVDNLKPQEMRSPWQGAAQLAQSAMLGLRQGNIARQEAGSRAELARIAAGIDPNTGPTMEQAAAIGAIDTDWGKTLMEGALKSRQDAAAREAGYKHDIAMQEDTQAEGRDTLAATQGFEHGEKALDRQGTIDAANARVDAEIAAATTEHERTVLENQRQERVAAEVKAKDAEIAAGKPLETTAKIMDDWRNKKFGEPDTPEAIQIRDQAIAAQNKKGVAASPTSDLNKVLDTQEGERWGKLTEASDMTGAKAPQLALLGKLIQVGPQGPILGTALEQIPGLKGFSNTAIAFDSIVKEVAPSLHVSGTGATSDLEYGGMLASLPKLSNMPEANALIYGVMQAKAQINLERGNIINAYRNGPRTAESAAQTRAALQALNTKSVIDPKLDALMQQVTGQSWTDWAKSAVNIGDAPSTDGSAVPAAASQSTDQDYPEGTEATRTLPDGTVETRVLRNGEWVPR